MAHYRHLLFAIILLAVPSLVQANDYQIPVISVDVSITEDGLVKITEHRTYVFNGDFSWADYRLPKEGYSSIDSIRVFEGDTAYINQNNEEPGTFSVSENDDAFTVKWHYSASDTTKTFSLSYILEGAIVVGPQWSEFFWNYAASGRDKSTNSFDLDLQLPGSISQDSLYTFTRSAADDFSFQTTPNGYRASGNAISKSQSVRIRTLFPTNLFDEASVSVSHPEFRLETVLSDEESYRLEQQKAAERREFFESITAEATLIICLMSLMIFILVYRKYGKRHSTSSLSTRETLVIPDEEPPAIIGRLMTAKQTTSNHLVATMFELARRGWFKITEEKSEEDGWLSSDETSYRVQSLSNDDESNEQIPKHQEMVLKFARKRISEGKDTFDELFKGSDQDVYKWFSNWTKQVKEEFEKRNWIDKKSYTGLFINMALQTVMVAASIVLLAYGSDLALAALIFTLLVLVSSLFIIRRTPDGEETHYRWKAYTDGLKNADKRTIRMQMLDRHFIYATAFHLTQKQITTLLESTNSPANSVIPWIILMNGSGTNAAAVASSMSTLAATGSSSFTGSTGAGTGVSAGAAGGGASGGAG